MENIIIQYLGLAAISFLFATGAEPIQLLKHKLNLLNIEDHNPSWKNLLIKLINCSLCSGFWIGLIFTQSIYSSAIISILAELICIQINKNKLL